MTAIVERVCATASAERATRVRAINLACGVLSGVIPDALRFCFDVCSSGTIAEGATLHIELVPARWRCRLCSTIADSPDMPLAPTCPQCASREMDLIDGRNFQLVSIEVD